MRIRTNAIIFFAAAFPFVIPLVPSTDTQPVFTLCALPFAVGSAIQCLGRTVHVKMSNAFMAAVIVGGGLACLTISMAVNGFAGTNTNRVVSFAMFLVAVTAGLLNQNIVTPRRVIGALCIYLLFTLVFFATNGAIETLIIRSRAEGALSSLLLTGRGASTLSPEPSFFAFQIFTLFLMARLLIWAELQQRSKHIIQIATIALLVASFSGYGLPYALMVIFLSGRRYIVGFGGLGVLALVLLVEVYRVESLRFVTLMFSIISGFAGSGFELKDVSILVRLTSLGEYLNTFRNNILVGDAFRHYGGGGLVSLLAALGLYGLFLVLVTAVAVFFSRIEAKLKLVLLMWLVLQFISGPVGLPMVGLLIGTVLARSRLGAVLSAVNLLIHRRGVANSPRSALA